MATVSSTSRPKKWERPSLVRLGDGAGSAGKNSNPSE
jgi:hypothetical protein